MDLTNGTQPWAHLWDTTAGRNPTLWPNLENQAWNRTLLPKLDPQPLCSTLGPNLYTQPWDPTLIPNLAWPPLYPWPCL